MIYQTPCPIGYICDQQKLVYPNKPCPPGLFCPITTIQGSQFYQVGLYKNITQFCAIGTYCKGGLSTNITSEPLNFEPVVSKCLPGMICNYGSQKPEG